LPDGPYAQVAPSSHGADLRKRVDTAGQDALSVSPEVTGVKPSEILNGVAPVSARAAHRSAVTTDGSLWAWSNNADRQLGFSQQTNNPPCWGSRRES
jgi:alpha-tubulin suppressor-like RCC1 family protein